MAKKYLEAGGHSFCSGSSFIFYLAFLRISRTSINLIRRNRLGFWGRLFSSNSSNVPDLNRTELGDCMAHLTLSGHREAAFGRILNNIYIHTMGGPLTMQECLYHAMFFCDQKYEVVKREPMRNVYTIDFCEQCILQTFFEGMAKMHHQDEKVRADSAYAINGIMDGCLANAPAELVEGWYSHAKDVIARTANIAQKNHSN